MPLDCPDDDAAIEAAKQHIDGHGIEVWQRDRRIAQFDSRPKDTGWIKGKLKPKRAGLNPQVSW